MYTSIVLPLDGSAFGNSALPVALVLASRSDAVLHLVHVCESGARECWASNAHTYEAHERQVRANLSAIADELSRNSSVQVEAQFLEGAVAPTLQRYLVDGGHDLVVMMTHGGGGLSRIWLGSVADELMRDAPVPVLLLRQDPAWLSNAAEPLFCRVLVPLDGSPMADVVLDGVLSLATTDVTVFVLLTILDQRHRTEFPEREAALGHLNGVADELRRSGALVEVRVELHQQVARGILEAAREQGVDLIALSTHGHGSMSRFLHGSTADKIVRGATVPVFCCCPDDARARLLTLM